MVSSRVYALGLLAVIVGATCALSLSVMPSSANSPLVSEKLDEQKVIRFTMTLQKSVFEVGEPVNITFAVTNIRDQSITLWHWAPEFDFIVYDSSNSRLYQWSMNKFFDMIIWSAPLDPGDNFTIVLVWPQTCNQTAYNEGVPVSHGRYFIVGLYHGLQTDPLQVQIGIDEPIPMIVKMGILGAGLAVPVLVLLAVGLLARKR